MVLGVVGALLFIINVGKVLDFTLGTERENKIVIEFVHFMLFMLGILCILLSAFVMGIMTPHCPP